MEDLIITEPETDIDETQEITTELEENKDEKEAELDTTLETENSQEDKIETPNESVKIKTEDANTTNCLALTIQEDHKLIAIKNVFLRSIRMSWKVVVSTITLALIRLFS